MNVSELFSRCCELVQQEPSPAVLRYMHQTLVLACAEALKGSGQAFGNLMAQTDYLCKRHGIGVADRIAIQAMRRHSNGTADEPLTAADLRYDVRALALFISTIFAEDIPHELVVRIPTMGRPTHLAMHVNQRYVRCVVTQWDDQYIYATTDEGSVCISTDDPTLRPLLTEGMQLNLLDCHREGQTIVPRLVVVEPDFLLDISSVAACFSELGHHPIAYTFGRLKPVSNTQPILLGNYASRVLDDIINQPDAQPAASLSHSFRQQALQFCTCREFDPESFKTAAFAQATNIRQTADLLFSPTPAADDRTAETYDRSRALLEPSFVCEQLGLQGRVDLMTTDMQLLVEQKSGKNWNIERPQPGQKGLQTESHYVQLLLYYGVLRHNFQLPFDRISARLLYSRYPAAQGLLVVNYYQQLFHEAIRLRNRIVAQEISIARHGFHTIEPQLSPDVLNERGVRSKLFDNYIRPQTERLVSPLQQLTPTQRQHAERMLTFVYREQLAQKTGVQEGQGGAVANLWNMPLAEKRDTGCIYYGLRLTRKEQSGDRSGIDRLTFSISDMGDDFLPNFRRGDMVCVYAYDGEPDLRKSILFKGVMEHMTDAEVTIRLNDGQQNPHVFSDTTYAIEPSFSDIGTTAAIRSIHAFCAASHDRRALLMGEREPRRDTSIALSRSYHPHYDEVVLKARQARDYFLLQGPPGTGKTSMALRFMVEEELASPSPPPFGGGRGEALLLLAYTHRAVDEICEMLGSASIDYLRLGNDTACDPRFADHLLSHAMGTRPRLDQMRQLLGQTRVVVSTTATMLARPYLLDVKHFGCCIIDEASQILEPNIVGLLCADSIDRFVLIGDHKQLPAVIQQPDDEPSLTPCRQSLFERLLDMERKAHRTDFTAVLRRQGRMHPDIAAFPNEMFYAQEQLQPVPCPHQEATSLDYNEPSLDHTDELLKRHRVLFFPSEPCSSISLSDKVNTSEAAIVADLAGCIFRQVGRDRFDPHRTLGIIVPYRNQIAMIRRQLEQLHEPLLLDISIDTVERYQGSQRDVIIYSFTIQHDYQRAFLTQHSFTEEGHLIDRKLNVAMTRARKQLLMTGNVETLQPNPLFAELIRRYRTDQFTPENEPSTPQ